MTITSDLETSIATADAERDSAMLQREACAKAYGLLKAIQGFYDYFTNYTIDNDGEIVLDPVDPHRGAWNGPYVGLSSTLRTQIKGVVNDLNTHLATLEP